MRSPEWGCLRGQPRAVPTYTGHFPSRSHLQAPSYGPVLSPVNKPHGGVSKLPSVNQLVGQPPPHGSAAGPSLGPMGEWLGGGAPGGWGRPKGGPGSGQDASARLRAQTRGGGPRLARQLWPRQGAQPREAPRPVLLPGVEGRLCVASDRPPPPARPRDPQHARPQPAGQRRDERQPQLPAHGLGVPLHPASLLPRRPQPGQVCGLLLGPATDPLTP